MAEGEILMTEQTVLHNISACAFDKVYQAKQQRERAYAFAIGAGLFAAGIIRAFVL